MKNIGYIRYILIILIALGLSSRVYSTNQEQTIKINSSQFSKYFIKKKFSSAFYLKPKYQEQLKEFSQQEKDIELKENFFGEDLAIRSSEGYYELSQFTQDNYQYKIIMYNGSGDGDAFMLNTQINSYTTDNKIIDSLLLNSQYGYEDVEIYSKFTIQADTITVNRYLIRGYIHVYDKVKDTEDIVICKIKTPQLVNKYIYKIHNGKFIKIQSKKIESPEACI